MAISTMYPAKPGSPKTTLTANIAADATSMTLYDATVLPTAPNLCVIGDDESAEIVSYTTITGNTVSGLLRGLGGTTASVWASGTSVARNYTSFDHDRFIENIQDLETNKLSSVAWGIIRGTLTNQTDLKNALNAKAPLVSPGLTGTPTAPTASSGNNTTQIATTAFVQTELGKYLSSTAAYYSNQDVIDTATDPTMVLTTNASYNTSLYNALGSTFAYVIQIFYGTPSATSNHLQIAFPYTATIGKMAFRVYSNNAWGSWHVLTAS